MKTCNLIQFYRNKKIKFPVSEWLETGLLLCFTGGFLDAYTYLVRGGVFANAQTGNIILLALGLASGAGISALRYLIPVLLFMTGVFLSELLLHRAARGKNFSSHACIVLAEMVILTLITATDFLPFAVPDMAVNALVSFAAAIQYDNFRRLEGMPFATAFCTGNLRSATEHIFRSSVKREKRAAISALKYLCTILAFVAGVCAGYFAINAFPDASGCALLFAAIPLASVFVFLLAEYLLSRNRRAVRALSPAEYPKARELILKTFTQYVAPDYEKEGIDAFRSFLYEKTEEKLFLGVYEDRKLKGVLITERDKSHICAFFVECGQQGKGYGGMLMREFLKQTNSVTVNASRYGKQIYEKFGFDALSEEQKKDGLIFTPMKYEVPTEKCN